MTSLKDTMVIIRPIATGVELFLQPSSGESMTVPISKQRARLLYESLHLYLMATIALE